MAHFDIIVVYLSNPMPSEQPFETQVPHFKNHYLAFALPVPARAQNKLDIYHITAFLLWKGSSKNKTTLLIFSHFFLPFPLNSLIDMVDKSDCSKTTNHLRLTDQQ